MSSCDVAIVGAGLAGLACARALRERGLNVVVLERSDGVGGRVRTDTQGGFLLDRGFQVLLPSYPEVHRLLDTKKLGLRRFKSACLVRWRDRFRWFADPVRSPLLFFRGLGNGFASLRDFARLARLRIEATENSLHHLFQSPEVSTRSLLESRGIGASLREAFFRPFIGGVTLDRELETSSRMFLFVWRMLCMGGAALPAAGMSAIPEQLAAGVDVRLGTGVRAVEDGRVALENGDSLQCRRIVLATGGENELHPSAQGVARWLGTTCLYFEAPSSPLRHPVLVLNGDEPGPINHLAVPSDICPSYAPPGRALVAVSVAGAHDRPEITDRVLAQLRSWFGAQVAAWHHLRTYVIEKALPAQPPGHLTPPERPVKIEPWLYQCGDHLDNASINGALVSGGRVAASILDPLNR